MDKAEPRRSLIYESVIENIKGELLSGRLEPGSRLPTVASLSQQLEVSPASVREAYRVLQSLGLLEVTRGRGTFVSENIPRGTSVIQYFHQAEKHNFTHLLEARKLIEPGVAALAAQRATTAEGQAILDAAVSMEQLANAGEDYTEPDVFFHELIFVAAHNPVTAGFLSAITHLLLDSRRLSMRMPGATEKAIHYHKLIAFAIRDADSDVAYSMMFQHVNDVAKDMTRLFSSE